MKLLAGLRTPAARYAVGRDPGAGGRYWYVVGPAGRPPRALPLDHDARHARLFLSAADQAAVGVPGLVALEVLARRVLGAQG